MNKKFIKMVSVTLIFSMLFSYYPIYANGIENKDTGYTEYSSNVQTTFDYLYDEEIFYEQYEQYRDAAIEQGREIDLHLKDAIDLKTLREKDEVIYLSYMGETEKGYAPNIEEFNIEVLNGIFGLNIVMKTPKDFGMPNNIDSMKTLLKSGQADFAGAYEYKYNLNQDTEFSRSDTFSYDNTYIFSKDYIKHIADINIESAKYSVSHIIGEILNVPKEKRLNREQAYTKIQTGELDYYIGTPSDIGFFIERGYTYKPIKNMEYMLEMQVMALSGKYDGFIHLLEKINVIDYYNTYKIESNNRNKYLNIKNNVSEELRNYIKNKKQITVGFYDSYGLLYVNNGKVEGYIDKYLDAFSFLTNLEIIYRDYSASSYNDLYVDIATGETDIMFLGVYDKSSSAIQDYINEPITVTTIPYAEQQINIVKNINSNYITSITDLNTSKVGYNKFNERILKNYEFLNIENATAYDSDEALANALQHKEVDYIITLPYFMEYLHSNNEDWCDIAVFNDDIYQNHMSVELSYVVGNQHEHSEELLQLLNYCTELVNQTKLYYDNIVEDMKIQNIIEYQNSIDKVIIITSLLSLIMLILIVRYRNEEEKLEESISKINKLDIESGVKNKTSYYDEYDNDKNYYCIMISPRLQEKVAKSSNTELHKRLYRTIGMKLLAYDSDINVDFYRFGSEEFIVLIECEDEDFEIKREVSKLVEHMRIPFRLKGDYIIMEYNIGVCYSEYAEDDEKLLLYTYYMLQNNSKSQYRLYNILKHRDLKEIKLYEAVEELLKRNLKKSLKLNFNPVVDNRINKINIYEVFPSVTVDGIDYKLDNFFNIARIGNSISRSDAFVVEKVCEIRNTYIEEGSISEDTIFAIAVSKQFIVKINEEFIKRVKVLNKIKDFSFCVFEITEETLDNIFVQEKMEKLNEYGFKFAIDKFDISHSSINNIIKNNIEYVKISDEFLKGNEKDYKLFTAVNNMLKGIDIKIAGYGIDSNKALDFIKTQNVDYIQGQAVISSMGQDEFEQFIKK